MPRLLSIGSGSMSVYRQVLDCALAKDTILSELAGNGLLDGAEIEADSE